MRSLKNLLESNPIIPALKNDEELEAAAGSSGEIVFIVMSTLRNIRNIVTKLKESGKIVFIHVDMVEGLSSENYTVNYIMEEIRPDGIITTKHNIVAYAKKQKISVIQRFFVLDSFSFKNSIQHIRENKPDAVEILPGIMPRMISRMADLINIPIIAGGLIESKDDIVKAINSGAIATSASDKKLWSL